MLILSDEDDSDDDVDGILDDDDQDDNVEDGLYDTDDDDDKDKDNMMMKVFYNDSKYYDVDDG